MDENENLVFLKEKEPEKIYKIIKKNEKKVSEPNLIYLISMIIILVFLIFIIIILILENNKLNNKLKYIINKDASNMNTSNKIK